MQTDLFGVAVTPTKIVLELRKIQAPRSLQAQDTERRENFHIPSFKNSKRWITKLPNGKPLKRPLLITSPEFQDWMEKAVRSLESQLFSTFQIDGDAIPQALSKLSVILSLLPCDDSMNDLPEGSWKRNQVAPGEEGATITIERL